jgi:branched-chain amino acid transport system ATP-binding protein
MSKPLLVAKGIRSGYGDITAVWDVSATLEASTILGVLGRNGAGKSTTLRALAGLNRVIEGSITLDGVDVTAAPAHSRASLGIALVAEGKRIFRLRTVEENLVLGAYCLGIRRRKLEARLQRQYDRFPVLGERRLAQAGSLSGGQQQMLAIAQALMSEPRVLLLDEPSAGLAPVILNEVLVAIESLRQDGMAIVLVEQAIDVVLSVAQDVVVLEFGRVALAGSTTDPDLRRAIEGTYLNSGAKHVENSRPSGFGGDRSPGEVHHLKLP